MQYIAVCGSVKSEPMTLKESLEGNEGKKWVRAIQDELDSIRRNETQTPLKLPEVKRAIDCKWVFKLKRESENKGIRYRAIFIIRGFSQR